MSDFADSWQRLVWVKELVSRVLPVVDEIDKQGRKGNLVAELRNCTEHDHIRYTLARPLVIPHEVGFTIADIATNARSCLDMAIEHLLQARGSSLAIPLRQFPIEDDVQILGDRTAKLLAALPVPHQRVLADLQPAYEQPGLGRFEVPINYTALQIREISNANKHRNIAPTLRTAQSMGFSYPAGVEMASEIELVFDQDETPWPVSDDSLILETRRPRGKLTTAQIQDVRPVTELTLMIHGTRYRLKRLREPSPIAAGDFLRKAPEYVAHALTVLEQASVHGDRPIDDFHPNVRWLA